MKTDSLISKSSEAKFVKYLSIYLSQKHSQIIFAPFYKSIYLIEQEECEVIDFKSSPEIIGEALKRNFHKFKIDENKRATGKLVDWSALQASKEKTKTGFEKNYIYFGVQGANETNITLVITSGLNYPIQIELTTTISAYCENYELGQRLLRIYNCDICDRKTNKPI